MADRRESSSAELDDDTLDNWEDGLEEEVSFTRSIFDSSST